MRFQSDRIKTPPSRLKAPDTAGGFGKSHYRSQAHTTWAKDVKRRDNYTCQACGVRYGQIHPKTGKPVWLIADHIVEIRDGGSATDIANGRTLCAVCHGTKTADAALQRSRRF